MHCTNHVVFLSPLWLLHNTLSGNTHKHHSHNTPTGVTAIEEVVGRNSPSMCVCITAYCTLLDCTLYSVVKSDSILLSAPVLGAAVVS